MREVNLQEEPTKIRIKIREPLHPRLRPHSKSKDRQRLLWRVAESDTMRLAGGTREGIETEIEIEKEMKGMGRRGAKDVGAEVGVQAETELEKETTEKETGTTDATEIEMAAAREVKAGIGIEETETETETDMTTMTVTGTTEKTTEEMREETKEEGNIDLVGGSRLLISSIL